MKALLFVIVFYAGESVHTQVVPFPTMAGCESAAVKVKSLDSGAYRPARHVRVVCVEDR